MAACTSLARASRGCGEWPEPARRSPSSCILSGIDEQSRRSFAPEVHPTRFPAGRYLLQLGKAWKFGTHEPRLKVLSGVPD